MQNKKTKKQKEKPITAKIANLGFIGQMAKHITNIETHKYGKPTKKDIQFCDKLLKIIDEEFQTFKKTLKKNKQQ